MPRGRKSPHGFPPGIHQDQHGAFWATLDGDEAKRWKERYPGRGRPPRRRARDLRDAIRVQRQLITDLNSGRDSQAENPTVATLIERWIAGRTKLEDSTRKRYGQSLAWQIKPLRFGRLKMQQVTPEHVREWIRQMIAMPCQSHPERKLSSRSIRNVFAVARAAFNAAIRDGLITMNPCSRIELPSPDDDEVHPLTTKQVERLLTEVDIYERGKPHRNATLYHVALRCGLRQGELIGLRWSDVDMQRMELRVDGQIQQKKRKRGKTSKARRTIPLTASLVALLQAHRRNQREEKSVSHAAWNAEELVFCSEAGTPYGNTNLYWQYIRILRRAGLADPCDVCQATGLKKGKKCPNCYGQLLIAQFRFHDLRHTYAALAIAAGVDIFTLSRRMGHESITTTANTYGHLYKGKTDDAEAIEQLLKRGIQQ